MNRIIVMAAGVLLATGSVAAMAGSSDTEQLAQCKELVSTHFGDDARTRLRSIRTRADGTHMRLTVTPANGEKQTLVCTQDEQGLSLNTRDGVALVGPADAEEKVSLAR